MSNEVREADLRALLGVAVIDPAEPLGEGLQASMLERAFTLIGCESVTYCEYDPVAGNVFVDNVYPASAVPDDLPTEGIWDLYWDFIGCSYQDRTGDERAVIKMSDFCTLPEIHSTGWYVEYLSRMQCERNIHMRIPTPGTRVRGFHFTRGRGSDFSERDRLLMALLRPHLIEACRQLERMRRGTPNLTPRQWQLLRLAAAGHTNNEIAAGLFVSPLTVRKHFENIFERLGVSNRAAAVALALPAEPGT